MRSNARAAATRPLNSLTWDLLRCHVFSLYPTIFRAAQLHSGRRTGHALDKQTSSTSAAVMQCEALPDPGAIRVPGGRCTAPR